MKGDEGRTFPEYGAGGDYLGARRARRAFRLCVASCVLLTVSLWFSELYLRYEPAERLYISALTHKPESARVFLRQAVKIDRESRQVPTPKYLQALAVREEDDLILPAFQEAYKLDPSNADLTLRYGCRLFLEGRAAEAAAKFREAAARAPDNALPMYLEAAVMPWVESDDGYLDESLALIARTNRSGKLLSMPRPLWFLGLPKDGEVYARLRRQIVDDCFGPLYRYTRHVVSQAHGQVAQHHVQHWDSWLMTIQEMGERILEGSEVGSLQAVAGLTIQLAALEERERVVELEGEHSAEDLAAHRLRLKSALDSLRAFEESRDARLHEDRSKHVFPFKLLGGAFAIIGFGCIASKISRAPRTAWTIPHTSQGKTVLFLTALFFLLLLESVIVLPDSAGISPYRMEVVKILWWAGLIGTAAFGLIYPAFVLPGTQQVILRADQADDAEDRLKAAQRCRRTAYMVLLWRYYAVLLGSLWCIACIWILTYRILSSLYPYQFSLLTTGLELEEAAAVSQALGMLE